MGRSAKKSVGRNAKVGKAPQETAPNRTAVNALLNRASAQTTAVSESIEPVDPTERLHVPPEGMVVALAAFLQLYWKGYPPELPQMLMQQGTADEWRGTADFAAREVILVKKYAAMGLGLPGVDATGKTMGHGSKQTDTYRIPFDRFMEILL